ncbi:conserved hypothetical protein [Methanospirillum hungatei JF-1]|uniref:Proteinase inhibitor I42 chagasin domain-containing protein n=1 Tax=Methanospirillum hungatei JF-1 (strain ATCC 27890 / DSM 864 / NBRC 100397 / JF-1) TaxID=323259 RepID=Q2FMF1_METHJ|nr:protease inhibitor I42 family protein [Methanospirillum hungatei]ABD41775.1 conserved hypothetical protein [Methanospirillum hungatei JF-1]
MNPYIFIILLLTGAVCFCGCTGTSSNPVETPVVPENTPGLSETDTESEPDIPLSFEEEIAMLQNKTDNESPIQLKVGEMTEVTLKENPTTGYTWNVSVSDGLAIVNDSFIGPENKQIVGAGGVHMWTLEAIAPGNQTFTGVYRRSWEPPADADTTYIQRYIVVE